MTCLNTIFRRKLPLLFAFCTVFILSNCESDVNPDIPPATSANIIGVVNLYTDGIKQISSAGMTVSVEGTSPLISTTTNSDGNFSLIDVPFGTYNIVFEKDGYGTYKIVDLEHKDTGQTTVITDNPSLGQVSTTAITGLTTSIENSEVKLEVTTDPAGSIGNTRYVRFFYSTSDQVSSIDYAQYSETYVVEINPYEFTLSQSDLTELGFTSGTEVFVKVYGESFFGNAYFDPIKNRFEFPNLNTTTVDAVSFIVP